MSYGRRYFGSMARHLGGSVTTPEQQDEAMRMAQEHPFGGKVDLSGNTNTPQADTSRHTQHTHTQGNGHETQ